MPNTLNQLTSKDIADGAVVQAAIDALTDVNSQQQSAIDSCVNIDKLNTAIQNIKTGESAFALKGGGTLYWWFSY